MDWTSTQRALEEEMVEQGDSVEVRYYEDDGKADTDRPSGEQNTINGEIKKVVDGLGGGIFVNVKSGVQTGSGRTFKLHNVPGGTITGTPPYSSRNKRVGLEAKIRRV